MADDLAASLRHARARPSEFVAVYDAYAQRLLVFFARRTFDIEAARDLTAETFAQAFEHHRRFRGTTDAEVGGWLYAIARHQISRYVRKGIVERKAMLRLGYRLTNVPEDEYQRIIALAGLTEVRERVAAAFATLPDPQSRALHLRIVEERPYAAVAAELGVSEQTARARVSRALHRLADAAEMTNAEVTP
jgi:RNA polymerase sigma-70 factor (ECF subfamily)